MDAHVVIGANYGDEGKGLMTDYFVRREKASMVVRFNGGAQAGHTVVDGGKRHVFSHFGSGTFGGAATYLSRFFVCNPILYRTEHAALTCLRIFKPKVLIDPLCMVTTPFDMLLNQEVERARSNRHGSCGVGFNETIERNRLLTSCIRYADLVNDNAGSLKRLLLRVRDEYVPARALALGLDLAATERCMDLSHLIRFLDDCEFMVEKSEPSLPAQIAGEKIVFEGAQGLMLDQNNVADFPHLTRSNTGCKNAVALAKSIGIDTLHLVYVTRSYLTRHGCGPLPNEWKPEEVPRGIYDKTNLPHPFQGSLRFAPLVMEDLLIRVEKDARHADGRIGSSGSVSMAITCADQFGCHAANYVSFGPSAGDVRDYRGSRNAKRMTA